MNAGTLNTITSLLGMINPALGVIGAFASSFGGDVNAKVEKVAGAVQDAANVAGALMPLVQQFANGNDVTDEDVREALAGMDDSLKQLDALIAARGG